MNIIELMKSETRMISLIWPKTYGLCIGFYVQHLLAPMVREPHCADGTYSASIGIQGACSWHGGVIYPFRFDNVIGFAVGIAFYAIFSGLKASFQSDKTELQHKIKEKISTKYENSAIEEYVTTLTSEELLQAMQEGEQKTNEYLQKYFGPDGPLPPKPKNRSYRRRR